MANKKFFVFLRFVLFFVFLFFETDNNNNNKNNNNNNKKTMDRLFKDLKIFDSSRLQRVETIEKNLIDLEEVRKVNPSLALFYEQNLQPPPPPLSLPLSISNTSKPLEKEGYVSWTLKVKPLDHKELISSVVFDLHPTFCPSSVQVLKAPFLISRSGWGTFVVKISVLDVFGKSYHFNHELSFQKGKNFFFFFCYLFLFLCCYFLTSFLKETTNIPNTSTSPPPTKPQNNHNNNNNNNNNNNT